MSEGPPTNTEEKAAQESAGEQPVQETEKPYAEMTTREQIAHNRAKLQEQDSAKLEKQEKRKEDMLALIANVRERQNLTSRKEALRGVLERDKDTIEDPQKRAAFIEEQNRGVQELDEKFPALNAEAERLERELGEQGLGRRIADGTADTSEAYE